MKVIHINFSDYGGGAEEFANWLSHTLEDSDLYVGRRMGSSSFVKLIPRSRMAWLFDFWDKVCWKIGFKRSLRSLLGIQDVGHFTFNALKNLPDFQNAEVVHLHNIHGEFFDINAVSKIASVKPIVWTLHDMWLMTGGEGFTFEGMPSSQRMAAYPMKNPIFDTRSHFQNVKMKLILKNRDSVGLVAPSLHHQHRVDEYFGFKNVNLIYYGIDLTVFNSSHREVFKLPQVLIFNSRSIYKNSIKVIDAILQTMADFHLHVIGENLKPWDDRLSVFNHGFIHDREKIAKLFKTIDIAAFWSNEETFGLLPAELAASGALVLLNKSLPVFHEHVDLYGAELFEDGKDLTAKIDNAVNRIVETREKGRFSSEKIEKNFNRKDTVIKYRYLYKKAKDQWKPV